MWKCGVRSPPPPSNIWIISFHNPCYSVRRSSFWSAADLPASRWSTGPMFWNGWGRSSSVGTSFCSRTRCRTQSLHLSPEYWNIQFLKHLFKMSVCMITNPRPLRSSRSRPRWAVGSPFVGRHRRSWKFASTCSCGVPTRRLCWWPCRVFDTSARRPTSAAPPTRSLSRPSCPITPLSVNWPLSATWWELVSSCLLQHHWLNESPFFSSGVLVSHINDCLFLGVWCTGRSTLQKRVMALLRRIEHPTPGNIEVMFSLVRIVRVFNGFHVNTWSISCHLCVCLNVCWFQLQAWEETHSKWDQATKQILNSPKNKADDGQVSFLSPCEVDVGISFTFSS